MDNSIVSLLEKRRQKNEQLKKQYMSSEDRIRDLELDVLRLIDYSIEQDRAMHRLEGLLFKTLRLLQAAAPAAQTASSSSFALPRKK